MSMLFKAVDQLSYQQGIPRNFTRTLSRKNWFLCPCLILMFCKNVIDLQPLCNYAWCHYPCLSLFYHGYWFWQTNNLLIYMILVVVYRIVIPVVAGSRPVVHPNKINKLSHFFGINLRIFWWQMTIWCNSDAMINLHRITLSLQFSFWLTS